jgi:hypothetical protein
MVDANIGVLPLLDGRIFAQPSLPDRVCDGGFATVVCV